MYLMTDLEIRLLLEQMTDGQREIFMAGVIYERERILKLIADEKIIISKGDILNG